MEKHSENSGSLCPIFQCIAQLPSSVIFRLSDVRVRITVCSSQFSFRFTCTQWYNNNCVGAPTASCPQNSCVTKKIKRRYFWRSWVVWRVPFERVRTQYDTYARPNGTPSTFRHLFLTTFLSSSHILDIRLPVIRSTHTHPLIHVNSENRTDSHFHFNFILFSRFIDNGHAQREHIKEYYNWHGSAFSV